MLALLLSYKIHKTQLLNTVFVHYKRIPCAIADPLNEQNSSNEDIKSIQHFNDAPNELIVK